MLLGRPHTDHNAFCGANNMCMLLWRHRWLKEIRGGGGLNFANFYHSGGIPKMVADRSLDVVLLRDL